MNRISTCFASLLLSCALTAQAQQYQLNSPDGKLIVNIEAGQALNWAIAHDGTTVLLPSDIAMQCTESERSEERRVGKECRSRWSPYH